MIVLFANKRCAIIYRYRLVQALVMCRGDKHDIVSNVSDTSARPYSPELPRIAGVSPTWIPAYWCCFTAFFSLFR